jgi:hypothetical protein
MFRYWIFAKSSLAATAPLLSGLLAFSALTQQPAPAATPDSRLARRGLG